ncbi:MAG: hypothetical protein ACO1OF_20985 [Adhaeribacter sp.]
MLKLEDVQENFNFCMSNIVYSIMGTTELLKEIKKLPIDKRLKIVEQTLKSIRESENKKQLEKASDALYEDYSTDKELTALTELDFEDFYEAR